MVIIDTAGGTTTAPLTPRALPSSGLSRPEPTSFNSSLAICRRHPAACRKSASFRGSRLIHPTASRQAVDARELVQKNFGLDRAPGFLCHRAAYADAMTTGSTPQELDQDGKAAAELAALFRFSFLHRERWK